MEETREALRRTTPAASKRLGRRRFNKRIDPDDNSTSRNRSRSCNCNARSRGHTGRSGLLRDLPTLGLPRARRSRLQSRPEVTRSKGRLSFCGTCDFSFELGWRSGHPTQRCGDLDMIAVSTVTRYCSTDDFTPAWRVETARRFRWSAGAGVPLRISEIDALSRPCGESCGLPFRRSQCP
jgi:hypothetical protein